MAVRTFSTNDLVNGHDMYVKFMKWREADIIAHHKKPENVKVLFYRNLMFNGEGTSKHNTEYRELCKWHCMKLSYDIWCEIVEAEKNSIRNTDPSSYKMIVNVSKKAISNFKSAVEKAIKDARCDYNSRIHMSDLKDFDGCRYLAMYWTYLDIAKDTKSKRYIPSAATIDRACEIFGYNTGDNPFIMNGRFYHKNVENKNEGSIIDAMINFDIGTPKTTGRVINSVPEEKVQEIIEEVKKGDPLDISISDLNLSTRTYCCLLRSQDIRTLGDILRKTPQELFKIRNFGRRSFDEVSGLIEKYGYKFPYSNSPAILIEENPAAEEPNAESKSEPVCENCKNLEEKLRARENECKSWEEQYGILGDKYRTVIAERNDLNCELDELKEQLAIANDRLKQVEETNGELKLNNNMLTQRVKSMAKETITSSDPIDIMKILTGSLASKGVDEVHVSIGGFHIDVKQTFIIHTRKDVV